MDPIRKQAIYWHGVCINTVMIFMLSIFSICKLQSVMPIQAEILFGAILLASFYYFIGFYRIRRML